MAVLLLFASAREAAGTSKLEIDAKTVGEVIAKAKDLLGDGFTAVVPSCKIWLNGEEVHDSATVTDKDEIAVLPPVSGGAL